MASSGQTAFVQYVYANEAIDALVPGQQPLNGSAAMERPAPTGSAVSFRGPTVSAEAPARPVRLKERRRIGDELTNLNTLIDDGRIIFSAGLSPSRRQVSLTVSLL